MLLGPFRHLSTRLYVTRWAIVRIASLRRSSMPVALYAAPVREDEPMRLRIFTEPQQGASYATLRTVAQTAEELGFDAFFRSDHYLNIWLVSGHPAPTPPCSP